MQFKTLYFENNTLYLLDQRKLPHEALYLSYQDYQQAGLAIKDMVVRGAPAIGVAAAYAMALAVLHPPQQNLEKLPNYLDDAAKYLISMRPTAVNLAWAVKRIQKIYFQEKFNSLLELQNKILNEATLIETEDIAMCKAMGEHGSQFIENGKTYLTHCNAGALATAGIGTALALFYTAHQQDKKFKVIADETRPYLQGARLTTWELQQSHIDVKLICDNSAAYLMQLGKIHGVVVGSDRIAANGDVANKIGTYNVALLAKAHNIPFYVVAPTSTIDLQTASGKDIPIEERPKEEVTQFFGHSCAPQSMEVYNFSFDVTPAELVTAIISEKGVAKFPFSEKLKHWCK